MAQNWDDFLGASPTSGPVVQQNAAGTWDDYLGSSPGSVSAAPISISAPDSFGPARVPLMLGSEAVKGVAGDIDAGASAIGKFIPALTGAPALAGEIQKNSPPAAAVDPTLVGALRELGVVDNPALVPQSPQERLAGATAQGVGAAAPVLLVGAPPVASLASGALGGASGELAHDAFPGVPYLPEAAGALAGLGVGGLTSRGASLGKIASGIGSSQDLEDAGNAIQGAARSWVKNNFVGDPASGIPSVVEQIKASIPPIAPTTLTPIDNYSKMARDLSTSAGRYAGPGTPLASPFITGINKELGSIGTQATWSEAEGLQRKLGNLIANPSLDPSADQTEVSALYKALLTDRESVAQANGIGPEFSAANGQISALYDLKRGVMSKLVKGDEPAPSDPLPGNLAKGLLSGGKNQGTDLATLRTVMPQALDELAAGHLNSTPKLWTGLSDDAKAALVPDPSTRAAIAAAVPQVGRAQSAVSHGIQALAGGSTGTAIGEVLSHWFPGLHPLVTGGLGELLGLATPSAWRGAKAMATNPRAAIQPLLGGAAGGRANGGS